MYKALYERNCSLLLFLKIMFWYTITQRNLLKHCISLEFLLLEGQVQVALRKALLIATGVEDFKTIYLGKLFLGNCSVTWNSLPKYCISADSLLIISYVHRALYLHCSFIINFLFILTLNK